MLYYGPDHWLSRRTDAARVGGNHLKNFGSDRRGRCVSVRRQMEGSTHVYKVRHSKTKTRLEKELK
jgi:hypothetical protein